MHRYKDMYKMLVTFHVYVMIMLMSNMFDVFPLIKHVIFDVYNFVNMLHSFDVKHMLCCERACF
jgi:hypothetical protein